MNDRATFLANRCGKLGASDIPTLLGHGYGDRPLSRLWHQKRQEFLTGEAVDSDETWPQAVGKAMESLILDRVEKILGVTIYRPVPPMFPESVPWLIVNCDGLIVDHDKKIVIPVDAKKVSSWKRDAWEGGVPEGYRSQMQTQKFACEHVYPGWTVPYSYLAPAIGEDEPEPVKVEWDRDLLQRGIDAGHAFMLSIELGEEMFDAPTQTEKTEREAAIEAAGELREKAERWLRLREEIGPKSKEVEALGKELMTLIPADTRKVSIGGVEVLRVDQRLTPRTDWDRLRAENPGLIDRYKLPPTVSTFPVASRRKNP